MADSEFGQAGDTKTHERVMRVVCLGRGVVEGGVTATGVGKLKWRTTIRGRIGSREFRVRVEEMGDEKLGGLGRGEGKKGRLYVEHRDGVLGFERARVGGSRFDAAAKGAIHRLNCFLDQRRGMVTEGSGEDSIPADAADAEKAQTERMKEIIEVMRVILAVQRPLTLAEQYQITNETFGEAVGVQGEPFRAKEFREKHRPWGNIPSYFETLSELMEMYKKRKELVLAGRMVGSSIAMGIKGIRKGILMVAWEIGKMQLVLEEMQIRLAKDGHQAAALIMPARRLWLEEVPDLYYWEKVSKINVWNATKKLGFFTYKLESKIRGFAAKEEAYIEESDADIFLRILRRPYLGRIKASDLDEPLLESKEAESLRRMKRERYDEHKFSMARAAWERLERAEGTERVVKRKGGEKTQEEEEEENSKSVIFKVVPDGK